MPSGKYTRKPTLERFMSKVCVLDNNCWEWQGWLHKKTGYGGFNLNGKNELAHRASYMLYKGPIPDTLTLDHVCHQVSTCIGGIACPHRRCVNPDHLTPMTAYDNFVRGHHDRTGIKAAIAAAIQERTGRTHCPRGHEYTAENTYTNNGRRHCRQCGRLKTAEYRIRKLSAAISTEAEAKQ